MDESLKDEIQSFTSACAEEELQFVIDLCHENSYTYNPAGTNRVAEMVLDTLGGILPYHEMIEQTEVGNHHVLRTHKTGKAIYLLGHMDTVFPPDHPFKRCKRDGDWLTGPGTGDMKGGIAAVVYALKALSEMGLLSRLPITLILGADEETGAATSHDLYEREAGRAAACLVTECAGVGGEVVLSRNGKAGASLDCFGREMHVGRGSGEKASAILEIAHKIVALEALNGFRDGVTINVGTVEGGLGPCTIPGHASSLLDMRWPDEADYGGLLDEIRRIAGAREQIGCRCEITILNHRPAMPLTEATEKMFGRLKEVAASIGLDLKYEHRRGTSDANYFGSAGVPTIDGLGPVCVDDHTPQERILIPTLTTRTTLLTLFLAEHGDALTRDRM